MRSSSTLNLVVSQRGITFGDRRSPSPSGVLTAFAPGAVKCDESRPGWLSALLLDMVTPPGPRAVDVRAGRFSAGRCKCVAPPGLTSCAPTKLRSKPAWPGASAPLLSGGENPPPAGLLRPDAGGALSAGRKPTQSFQQVGSFEERRKKETARLLFLRPLMCGDGCLRGGKRVGARAPPADFRPGRRRAVGCRRLRWAAGGAAAADRRCRARAAGRGARPAGAHARARSSAVAGQPRRRRPGARSASAGGLGRPGQPQLQPQLALLVLQLPLPAVQKGQVPPARAGRIFQFRRSRDCSGPTATLQRSNNDTAAPVNRHQPRRCTVGRGEDV